jgi:two-component system phosphate regulon response regulator PhoB
VGCKVFTARDATGALENANALSPDVIAMDFEIPRLAGCEVIQRLKESPSTRRIPVVVLASDPASRLKAFDLGCAAYLTTPCEPEIVWAQIRALLRVD